MSTITSVFRVLLIALMASLALHAHATTHSNLAKEKRWENQIVDSLMVGESVKLKANDVEFLGLYTAPTTQNAKGGVIILHGIGAHPAWPDVINPLRIELPERGWHTLSLQMPILKNGAPPEQYSPLFPEVPARIKAGIAFLKSKGIKNIILSGHSMGAVMASYYLSEDPDPGINTFVMISGDVGMPQQPYMDSLKHFRKMKHINIVDIHGSEDAKRVLDTVVIRNPLGKKLHRDHYWSLEVKGADHFYRGKQNDLVNSVDLQLTRLINQK